MSISTYLSGTAMQFSKNIWVIWVTVAAEWLCFLSLVRYSLPKVRYPLGSLLLLAGNLVLQYRFYPISLHCVIQILLWTCYICWQTGYRWYGALFESGFFCLLLEVGKAFFRGPTLAYLLAEHWPGLTPQRISMATFAIYLLYLFILSFLFSRIHFKMEYLHFTPWQTAGILFPLFLYLFVRQYQSGLGEGTDADIYISFELIALAIAVCAVIVITTIIRMLLVDNRKNELLRERMLSEQQHSQYLIQKEALDAVNRRYHDLKHYLSVLESAGSGDHDELMSFASRLRGEIMDYETIQKTGSKTLDVLLAQRISECQEKDIRLIPYVDGRGLDFMNVVDLCTIFGNAMDNAIEESMKIEEAQKREIRVKIESYGKLVIFRFANACHAPVRAEGSVIPTTKKDPVSHGYGLSSIREIAERYGGSMTVNTRDTSFELVVMIPS
ncbi:MAG: sensor histidine kinase [Lachnospiraceae bacterium]|nr:sensor histidine kinase [Lachnospiraceae bacterium]